MSRPRRELVPDSCYHVTTRCNNREFHLTQPLCRNLLLYALSQAIKEYGFKLYALCGIVPRPGIDGVSALTPAVPLHTNPKRERGLTQVLAAEWEKTLAHASG